jgi:hypothetical protein
VPKEVAALREELAELRQRVAAAPAGAAPAGGADLKALQDVIASFEMELTDMAGEIGKLKKQPAAAAALPAGAVDHTQIEAAVHKAVTDGVAKGFVASDAFTTILDERFRIILDYLHSEVIPKEIRKHLGGGRPPAVTDTHIT